MEFFVILLTFASALGAYQFFLWLYNKQFRPDIIVGILPHYEMTEEDQELDKYGSYCIANEFMFDPAYFARPYDIDCAESILDGNTHPQAHRKVLRNEDGRCRLPIVVQNLGKGFSKELFYVVSFYEHPPLSYKKSEGLIKVVQLTMERQDKCYLYSSESSQNKHTDQLVTSDDMICQIYGDIGLLADYVYFESFLEPKAFVLNILDIQVSQEISEFTVLFNIFSMQNERLMISKYQHCRVIDTLDKTKETANK